MSDARQMTVQEEMDYEMLPEYDLKNGRRNPYAARVRTGDRTSGYLVKIEPDLYEKFPGSEAVNEALRLVLKQREENLKQREQDAA